MAVVSRKRENLSLATCLVTDAVGMMVHIKGPAVGDVYDVEVADPSDFDKMPAAALIIDKLDDTNCVIQFSGIVRSVYSGLLSGVHLFVDDDGMLSDNPPEPTPTKPTMFTQSVGVTLSDDTIYLDPGQLLTRQLY